MTTLTPATAADAATNAGGNGSAGASNSVSGGSQQKGHRYICLHI